MLDNTPNRPTKFRTKNWVKINNDSRGMYNKDNQIRFKTSMLRSSLCDYSGAYILVKGTITVAQETATAQNNANKKVICVPFTSCIRRINNTQVDDAQYIYVLMPKYNLMEYSGNYPKTSGVLWQYCGDEAAVDNNGATNDFTAGNADVNLDLFWSKNSVVVAANVATQIAIFSITDAKLYVPVLTLLIQDKTA